MHNYNFKLRNIIVFISLYIKWIALLAGRGGREQSLLIPEFSNFGQNHKRSGSDKDQKVFLCQMQKKIDNFTMFL